MIRKALFVAIAAAAAAGLLSILENHFDDGPPRRLVNKSEIPVFGCTSESRTEEMLRLVKVDDKVGFWLMFFRGALGDGCVIIYQDDELTYYGDPSKARLLKARIRGYPDTVWVPSWYIPKMLGES